MEILYEILVVVAILLAAFAFILFTWVFGESLMVISDRAERKVTEATKRWLGEED